MILSFIDASRSIRRGDILELGHLLQSFMPQKVTIILYIMEPLMENEIRLSLLGDNSEDFGI